MKNNSPRPFIGTSTRDIQNRTINWPGPTSYRNTNNLSTNKEMYQKVSIRGRGNPRNTSGDSPGPHYNTIEALKKIKRHLPAYKIGTSPKLDRNIKSNRYNPGPGAYNLQAELTKQTMHLKPTFPRAKRLNLVRDERSPGPGQYMLPTKFNELQDY